MDARITMESCPRCCGEGACRDQHLDSGVYPIQASCVLCKGSGWVRVDVASSYREAARAERARLYA